MLTWKSIGRWSVALTLSLTSVVQAAPPTFWPTWGDGKAEVSTYSLLQPRYGAERPGKVVLIFVTETFSESSRVKADPGKHPPSDEFPVLKLNELRAFQTGIYDYHVMTSVFSHVEKRGARLAGEPTKITFSSQEWCGQVYHQLRFDARSVRDQQHSYFDGEGSLDRALPLPSGFLTADELPIRLRGLLDELVPPGESRHFPFLPSLRYVRLLHKPLAWTETTVKRAAGTESVTVSAGTFEIQKWEVSPQVGQSTTWWIEKNPPHRIIRWHGNDGEQAELLASERLPYWTLNKPGDEKTLDALKLTPLTPPAPLTPPTP
ncbi:MAG: hypothetical protein ACKO6N_07820 [Myxococcota bacterium]